jgi:hypothetical protein
VMEMLGTSGPFMPERAGIKYNIIVMEWFNQWKYYVGLKDTPPSSDKEESKEAS